MQHYVCRSPTVFLSLLLGLLASTLLSGFETYVTATSSSDDIYYKRRTENVISDVGREKMRRNRKCLFRRGPRRSRCWLIGLRWLRTLFILTTSLRLIPRHSLKRHFCWFSCLLLLAGVWRTSVENPWGISVLLPTNDTIFCFSLAFNRLFRFDGIFYNLFTFLLSSAD